MEDTQNQNLPKKNKVGLKVFLVIIMQDVIMIPLAILWIVILGGNKMSLPTELIVAVILFTISLHLTLLILKKKFVFEDAKKVSRWLSTIIAGFLAGAFLLSGDAKYLLQMIIYSNIIYFYTKAFIKRKFKN